MNIVQYKFGSCETHERVQSACRGARHLTYSGWVHQVLVPNASNYPYFQNIKHTFNQYETVGNKYNAGYIDFHYTLLIN